MRRPLLTALVLAVAAAGCDRAVEMTLTAPVAGADIDTSCVSAVEVTFRGPDPFDEVSHCVEITPGRVKSLRNHNLSGIFDQPLPDFTIEAVQVRGVAAGAGCTSDNAIGPTIFVASTDRVGDQIDLALRGVLSCADRVDTPSSVRAIDLGALITDGSCVATEGLLVQPGEIFPTLLYPDQGWLNYYWAAPVAVPAGGLVTLPYTFSAAVTGSCVAVDGDDGADFVSGCITPPGRGACGPEAEYHYLPITPVAQASLTTEELISRSVVVFGVVLDRDRAPIANATITTAADDTVIHYTNPAGQGFIAAAGAGTTAAGTFTVLANKPVLIEVAAPGKATRRVMASGYGATVVVMDAGTN